MRKLIIVGSAAALLLAAITAPPTLAALLGPLIALIAEPRQRVADPGPRGVRIDKDGVFANFFPARSPDQGPAILLLGGSEGGLSPGEDDEIKGLSAAGFNVLYLCYFGCRGTPRELVAVPLETFGRGLAFLRAQPGVDPNRIAVLGESKGAEAALLVGTRDPKVRAVIAATPSSVVWPGITFTLAIFSSSPSWTVGGAPVPFLPYAFGSFFKGVFGIYSDALPAQRQHPDAVIPVERIVGRILLVCGEADSLWPSCPMADQIALRLGTRGRPAAMVLRYKNAGHAVFGAPVEPASPGYPRLARTGGTPDGNAAARRDDWPKAIAFLKASLRIP